MSDPLMDDHDHPSSTPLDILLNAITGSDPAVPYDFSENDVHPALLATGVGQSTATATGSRGSRQGHDATEGDMIDFNSFLAQSDFGINMASSSFVDASGAGGSTVSESVEDGKMRNRIMDLLVDEKATATGSSMTSIHVWHPTAGQKSYGKERRLLAPPPFIQATGPLVPHLASVTLSTMSERSTQPMSSQTHSVSSAGQDTGIIEPLDSDQDDVLPRKRNRTKKQLESKRLFQAAVSKSGFAGTLPHQRDKQAEVEREALAEGIIFPGLWITQAAKEGGTEGEEMAGVKKKDKGFRLALDLVVNSGSQHMPKAQDSQADTIAAIGGTSTTTETVSAPSATEAAGGETRPALWTTLVSPSLSIISKPSIKTAKNRTLSTCFPESASFALWVRINAQTVRTKYMKLDTAGAQPRLTSRTGKWTPFRFEIVHRPDRLAHAAKRRSGIGYADANLDPEFAVDTAYPLEQEDESVGAKVLRYGSIVRLVDLQSGIKSDPVRLVKVDKNEVVVGLDEGQPVSEMQRIALVRLRSEAGDEGEQLQEMTGSDGGRVYLSAPGARLGGGELRSDDGRRRPVPRVTGYTAPPETQNEPDPPKSEGQAAHPATLDDADLTLFDGSFSFPMAPVPATQTVSPPDAEPDRNAAPGSLMPEEQTGAGDGLPFGLDALPDLNDLTSYPEEQHQEAPEHNSSPIDRPRKRLKTKRNALALAVMAENEMESQQTSLTWRGSVRKEADRELPERKGSIRRRVEVEEVEDWMCWVIAGVDKYACEIYDTPKDSSASSVPRAPAVKPVQLASPQLHSSSSHNTAQFIELTLSDFFDQHPSRPQPFQVYLGSIGPSRCETFRSTFTKDPTRDFKTPIQPWDGEILGDPIEPADHPYGGSIMVSNFPARTAHVIVHVRLPSLAEIQATSETLQSRISAAATSFEPKAIGSSTKDQVGTIQEPAATQTQGTSVPQLLKPGAIELALPPLSDAASWLAAADGLEIGDLDGNEAIRQAIQNVSRAAEAAAHANTQAAQADTLVDPSLLGEAKDNQVAVPGDSVAPVNGGEEPPNDAFALGVDDQVELTVPETISGKRGGLTQLPILLVHGDVIQSIGTSLVIADGRVSLIDS